MVACCAVPALIGAGVAAGVLGTIGALLSSPLAIAAGAVFALLVIVLLVRKCIRPSTTVECCPPLPASTQTGATGEEVR
jgi:membrane associated rhomboid family serine protease